MCVDAMSFEINILLNCKYIFNSNGFVSGDDYQKFRMEMTCEKYKK